MNCETLTDDEIKLRMMISERFASTLAEVNDMKIEEICELLKLIKIKSSYPEKKLVEKNQKWKNRYYTDNAFREKVINTSKKALREKYVKKPRCNVCNHLERTCTCDNKISTQQNIICN